MPEIRDLVIDGQPARGYEVEFQAEPSSRADIVVTLPNGSHISYELKPRKAYVLVDADDQPLRTDTGEPRVVVESDTTVAAEIAESTERVTERTEQGDGIPRAELDALTDEMMADHAWLLDELAKR